MDDLHLVSAYHVYFGEEFGSETRATHFFRGKPDAPFHLDYCLVPESWKQAITRVEVGTHDEWHRHSDHAPLIVDLDDSRLP
jgi:endonuclease/exonuclease/phosphatase family metal-dependent hydrolase